MHLCIPRTQYKGTGHCYAVVITDRHGKYFQSFFGDHIKTYEQSLSIIGLLVASSMASEPNDFLSSD